MACCTPQGPAGGRPPPSAPHACLHGHRRNEPVQFATLWRRHSPLQSGLTPAGPRPSGRRPPGRAAPPPGTEGANEARTRHPARPHTYCDPRLHQIYPSAAPHDATPRRGAKADGTALARRSRARMPRARRAALPPPARAAPRRWGPCPLSLSSWYAARMQALCRARRRGLNPEPPRRARAPPFLTSAQLPPDSPPPAPRGRALARRSCRQRAGRATPRQRTARAGPSACQTHAVLNPPPQHPRLGGRRDAAAITARRAWGRRAPRAPV
jgi:hypothetical protein